MMLPSCNMLLCLLFWVTAYGNTLTISSTVNSTELASEIFTGLTLNSSCETAYQCRGKLVCTDGQCRCSENYIWNGTNCIEEQTLNSKCKRNLGCETTLFCIYGTCQCPQMHYWNGNICITKKTANDTCSNIGECGGKLICQDGVCQCPVNLFLNGNKCIFKNFEGHSCQSYVGCAENLECRESICQCSESKYWDTSKCYAKKSIDDACTREKECSTTLHCDRSVCQCASSNYWNGSTCSLKKDENSFCNSSIECKATLQCRNNQCLCCEQDFWNGQFCERKRNMTLRCHETVQCQDTLQCIRGICQCDLTEYWTQTACAKNICAIDHCMNGGKCQISGKIKRCECVDGYLGSNCQYADGRANDFIVIFQQSYLTNPSPRILPTAKRSMLISVFYFANNKNISVTLNSADTHYILDSNVLMTNGLHQAGAEIHSNVPITLYGFLFVRHYSEGFFVLPTQFASRDYIIPSFTVSSPHRKYCQSLFALTPVFSNTVIEIHFKMEEGSVSYDNNQYSNNQTLQLVLNKYTAFQIWHTSDLTGTRIIASKPIVVVSGNRCNYINNKGSCQPFIEMIVPTDQLDNVYVIPYLNYRSESTVRVLAVNDTSIVLKNGNSRSKKVIKSRHFLDYLHTSISIVSSENDVMVDIFPHELSDLHGDAFMMMIPGINQYLFDYVFMVPTDFESFISITVPTNAVDGFVLNGNFVNLKTVFSISEDKYSFSSFSIPISSGQHHITHREKTRFGLWIYGNHTNYEAYGFPAGMAFKTL